MGLLKQSDSPDRLSRGNGALGVCAVVAPILVPGLCRQVFAPLVTARRNDGVAKDRVQPRLEIRARDKLVPVFPRFQHRGLREILIKRAVIAFAADKGARITLRIWQQRGQRSAELKFLIMRHVPGPCNVRCEHGPRVLNR